MKHKERSFQESLIMWEVLKEQETAQRGAELYDSLGVVALPGKLVAEPTPGPRRSTFWDAFRRGRDNS